MIRIKNKSIAPTGRFLVRIKNSSKPTYWYAGAWYLGKDFRVKWNNKYKKWHVIGETKYIQRRDATVIRKIR